MYQSCACAAATAAADVPNAAGFLPLRSHHTLLLLLLMVSPSSCFALYSATAAAVTQLR
jgi:hypothetical protein